jgi:hypothetical protein
MNSQLMIVAGVSRRIIIAPPQFDRFRTSKQSIIVSVAELASSRYTPPPHMSATL